MSFRGKLIEKAAEQVVQTAAAHAGKHISQKAIDHTLATAKRKVVAGYESVRGAISDSFGDDVPSVQLPTYVLSIHDRQMIHAWYRQGVAEGYDTLQDRELHQRLCGDLL